MKCKIIAAICAICLLLSGCSFSMLDGEYVYTQPHEDNNSLQENAAVHARNYAQLYGALAAMVESGQDQGVIIVSSYDKNRVSIDVQHASQQLRKEHPIAAYAVSDISAARSIPSLLTPYRTYPQNWEKPAAKMPLRCRLHTCMTVRRSVRSRM